MSSYPFEASRGRILHGYILSNWEGMKTGKAKKGKRFNIDDYDSCLY